ncbi:MAG: hypothetical protein U5K79_04045 [Cyclobacteriaceae bacterium]|nr:hypothetical protein [Cyclobacteriaceae bacterium]
MRLCCLCWLSGRSEKVQWASEVLYQYNQDSTFSGPRILGPPDAFPPGHLNYNAFRLDKEAAFGTIKVGFEKPQFTQQVVIIESNLPGRVSQVKLIDQVRLQLHHLSTGSVSCSGQVQDNGTEYSENGLPRQSHRSEYEFDTLSGLFADRCDRYH